MAADVPSWSGATSASISVYRDAIAQMREEELVTCFYADGQRFDLVGAVDMLERGEAYSDPSAPSILLSLRRKLRDCPDYCMKCRVFTSRQKHRCVDCLVVTPLLKVPNDCNCAAPCEFSVRVPHAREGSSALPAVVLASGAVVKRKQHVV